MARDARYLLDFRQVLRWDSVPFHDSSSGKPEAVSHLREHPALGADQVHSVDHSRRLPQGSGSGKHNRLPMVHRLFGTMRRMEIGNRIAHARQQANMSQSDLARALGVTRGLVGQWESHRKKPGRELLRKVAEVTMTSVDELLTGEGQPVSVSDPTLLAILRRAMRMTPAQRKNLLELLGVAGDVAREMEKQSEPAEP